MKNENNDPIETIPNTKIRYVMSSLPQPTGPLCPKPAEPMPVLVSHVVAPRIRQNWAGEVARKVVHLESGYVFDTARDAAMSFGISAELVRRHAGGAYQGVRKFKYLEAA